MSTLPVPPALARPAAPPGEPEGAPAPAKPPGARKASKASAPEAAGSAAAPPEGSSRARALLAAPATSGSTPGWMAAASEASAAGYAAPASSSGEWAFLDAKGTSIEDKLFLFMKKVLEKTDQELVDKMKEYRARFVEAPKASAPKKKGMSLFDIAKSVVPALDVAQKLLGEPALKKLASSLGGPLLAAAATAAGLPQLAPLALKYGGDLAGLAFQDLGGSAASAPAPAASAAGSPDEKLAMLEIQVLVEKQQRMFAAVSGTLKAMHDAQMVAIHNLR
jgi:hypothetical protein